MHSMTVDRKRNYDWGNVHSQILLLDIWGACDDYKEQKKIEMTEASASVCLLQATVMHNFILPSQNERKSTNQQGRDQASLPRGTVKKEEI